MGKGLSKLSSNEIMNQDEQEVAQAKQHLRAACPKDRRELKFSRALSTYIYLEYTSNQAIW